MRTRLRQRFGTLRWKLAGSYVLVTLLVVLTLEVLALVVLVPAVDPLVGWFTQQASEEIANDPDMQREFAAASPNAAQLGEYLRRFQPNQQVVVSLNPDASLAARAPVPAASPNAPAAPVDLVVVLLDNAGRIITGTQQLDVVPGAALSDIAPGLAQTVVDSALRGTSNRSRDAQGFHAATPVQNAQQDVLGAVYVRLPGVPLLDIFQGLLVVLPISAGAILISSGFIGLIFGLIAGRGFSRRLKRLTLASAAMASGDLQQRIDDRSADEIGQLARQFNTMAAQLNENMRALRLLVDQNAQLAEQATQLATVEERNRLARDLHDSVSQELFSLTMQAAAARRLVATKPDQAASQLGEIQATAQQALQETRSLIFALRPAQLDGRGLGPALRDLQTAARERQGLEIDLRIGGERRLPLDHEQAVFRIVQEALANVVRHSGARQADVDLQYTEQDVCLTIKDHGRGFDLNVRRNARSIGLDSMRERAQALGGTLQIDTAPAQGTTVSVCLPAPTEY